MMQPDNFDNQRNTQKRQQYFVSYLDSVMQDKEPEYKMLETVIHQIRQGGKHTSLIEKIRTCDPVDIAKWKVKLPAVMFAGFFSGKTADSVKTHTGLCVLDFDHLGDKYDSVFSELVSDKCAMLVFRSPSGDGIKAVFRIPASIDTHRQSVQALTKKYGHIEGYQEFADINRKCFLSVDPNAYYNPDAQEFDQLFDREAQERELYKKRKAEYIAIGSVITDQEKIFRNLDKWIRETRGEYYAQGNRHLFIFKLACACNRFGLDMYNALDYLHDEYGNADGYVAKEKFERIIKDAYKRYQIQYNTSFFDNSYIIISQNNKETIIDNEIISEFNLLSDNFSDEELTIKVEVAREVVVRQAIAKKEQNSEKTIESIIEKVLPKRLCALVDELDEQNLYPKAYSLASMLFATSVAIGKTQKVVHNGYSNFPCVWFAMVGMPGANKSAPVKWFLNPITKKDEGHYIEYKDDLKEYDSLSKKEKENATRPQRKQHIVQDVTLEALQYVLDYNHRGVGLYSDELDTWYSSFDRYNKSGDQSAWLSIWSGMAVNRNRVTSRDVFISDPFCSVIGTIQPSILRELGAGNRQNNGFIYRILFLSHNEPKKALVRDYDNGKEAARKKLWLRTILDIMCLENTHEIEFTSQATKLIFDWMESQRLKYNKLISEKNESYAMLLSKLEIYLPRLCLILNNLHSVTDQYFSEGDHRMGTIEADIVEMAIVLVDYFETSSLEALRLIVDTNPIETLTDMKKIVYEALPERFTTATGVLIAEKAGMSVATFKRFLQDKNLYQQIKWGEYGKRL
ncbi:MAG: DUF3987 domain-containing protein [Leadbetterella sp.]